MTALPDQIRLAGDQPREGSAPNSQLSILNSQLPPRDPLADLTDDQRRQVGQRLGIVQAWQSLCRDFSSGGLSKSVALRTFLSTHDVRRSTLYRWAQRYRDEGLIGLLDGRNSQLSTLDSQFSPAAWQFFLSVYLTIHRRSVALCYQITAHRAREEGWTWPSLRSIQRRVQLDLPRVYSDYWRLGEKEWWRLHPGKLVRDYSQYRAGQWWVGDFHEFDLFCRRSESDPTIIRPLLSAFIDLRSRIIPGWRICERENQDTVLLAFRAGVEQWGPPEFVVIDNGKPYRACGVSGGRPRVSRKIEDEDYLRSVFGGLNVVPHFAIPYNPNSKPIEPWFETVESQFVACFPTYCGGNKDERFRAAHKLAHQDPSRCPTIDQLCEKFGRYITAYHATPHHGEAMNHLPPAEAFKQFDPIPRAVLPDGALDVLLMRVTKIPTTTKDGQRVLKPIKVTQQGVRHNGIDYGQHDPRLFELHGREVTLRVHPEDASYVIVCDLAGTPICRARNNRLELTGVTQDDVAAGIRDQRHARKLVRAMFEGQTKAARRDISDLAIQARMSAAEQANPKRLAATGTDDRVPDRNLRPLRSDFAAAMEQFQTREVQPSIDTPAEQPLNFEDLADLLPGEQSKDEPGAIVFDLEKVGDFL